MAMTVKVKKKPEKKARKKTDKTQKMVQSGIKGSFWIKTVNTELYDKLREMNNPNLSIMHWQKNRVLRAASVFFVGAALALIINIKIMILAIGVPIFLYYMQAKDIDRAYNQFKFERHLQFTKFTRLLVPYLKQATDGVNLYSIFNKIVKRLDYEADRGLLLKLMQDMSDKPNDIAPFIEYAKQSSGTDMSILFMSTIYDLRHGSADITVIEELGKLASEELMNGIDSIINFKLRRFTYFPTKVTMSTFILVMGFAISVLILNLKGMNITGTLHR